MRDDSITEVASGVYLVHGSNTNWTIIKDGDAATLVDSGYPGDRRQLLESLAAVGVAPGAVAALLVTHAHNDHVGSAQYLSAEHGVPVLLHPREVAHARREFLDQVTLRTILRHSWRPSVARWAVHALRSGGKADVRVAQPRAFEPGVALDLPGGPVPLHTPGHTSGHCSYHLPDAGVLLTGDELVSGHPTSPLAGPQLLPRMFDKERERAVASLDVLEKVAADLLLPGHGPLHRGAAAEAVRAARERVR